MPITRSAALVAAGLAAGLVIGGTTVAVAQSSASTVKVCATKKGVVRSANAKGACPKKTKKKAVAVRGPVGARGAAGPVGARGPSDAWKISEQGRANAVKVPAGSYVASGIVYLGRATADAQCWIYHQTSTGSVGQGSYFPGTSTAATLPISDSFTVAVPSEVWVQCFGNDVAYKVSPNVTILAVGALHD